MRRACIDIGSNTTRLLVADCQPDQLVAVHQARAFTDLGRARRQDGTIPATTIATVAEVVAEQLEAARALGAQEIRCVATASVRRAANRDELSRWIERRCPDLKVEVLSGEDEARLAFLGAATTLSDTPRGDRLGVADVGGGSSELVVGTAGRGVSWWTSLPLGSGDLAAQFMPSDPPAAGELDEAAAHVQAVLRDVKPPPVTGAVAVGGSATSMLSLGRAVLDAEAFRRSLQLLCGRPSEAIAADSGLDVRRVRILPAGLLILRGVADLFGAPLQVSSGGVREGALLDGA